MASEVLSILIRADTTAFGRAMRQASVDTGKMGKSVELADGKAKGLSRGLQQFGKAAAVGLAAIGVGAVTLAGGFVRAAEESAKVTAQTDAVIRSMGLSAQVSAGQIAKLSETLSLKAGIDDELIQSGANVLLTFAKVAKSAGESGGVFERATAAALDMSVALDKDMQGAVLQVGKALNDPIKGLTALQRAGVSFTQAQRDQIAAMVEAGDVAGAQKLILAELEKQFGGSAEAQATASDKLGVAWANLQETLGEKLLPVVEAFSSWLTETGIPAVEAMIGWIERNQTTMLVLAAVVGGVLVAAFGAWAVSVIAATWPILAIGAAVGLVALLVIKHFDTIKQAFASAFNWLKNNWPLVLGILTGPIGLAVLAIVKHWDTIKRGISSLKTWIADTASGMWEGLKSGLIAVVNWIIRRLNEIVNAIDVAAGPSINFPEIPKVSTGGGGGSISYRRPPRNIFHAGGVVPGPRGQEIAAVLQAGERIISLPEIDAMGRMAHRLSFDGGGQVINVTYALTFNGPTNDKQVVEALKREVRANGPLDVAVRQ